jgi:hypothetical protein
MRPGGIGRPRQLQVRVFLAAVLLTVEHCHTLHLDEVHAVLTAKIARSAQIAIGSRYRPTKRLRDGRLVATGPVRPLSLRQVRYMLEAIEKKLAYTEGRVPDLPDDDRTTRAAALQSISDWLLAASVLTGRHVNGTYALDDSGHRSWARYKKDSVSFDVDARAGHKTASIGETEGYFGWKIFALTRLPDVDAEPDLFPYLVERVQVEPANADEAASALPMLDRLIAAGQPVKQLLADRAWSYTVPRRWAYELRRRNIEQVVDLHENDYGVRDYHGTPIMKGRPYCVAAPHDAAELRRPATLGDGPELETYISAGEEFDRLWAHRRVAGPDSNGNERWECVAHAGGRRCPLVALSMNYPPTVPLIENPPDAATAPLTCQQRTIPLPGNVTPKIRQKLRHGSRAWVRSWRRRTYVETNYGNVKNDATENLNRSSLRVVGKVKVTLLISLAVMAMNLRLTRVWAQRTGQFPHPALLPDPPDPGFEELPPEPDAPPPATGPPLAA